MLKILRDDLRHIIDSGCSLGTKLPETPLLWMAPFRHRFNQLFDELVIHAKWSVPAKWEVDVTPLECLSLQRVAEEALTNIVKHSHATVVQIRIYYENSALIMEVEDNGVGGDVDLVNQAGLSVGLRSMSGCLERMNADMQITSRAGQTILKVIKNYG